MKPEEMAFVFDFDGTIHKKYLNGKKHRLLFLF